MTWLAMALALAMLPAHTSAAPPATAPHREAEGVSRALRVTVPHLSPARRRLYARLMVAAARRHGIGVGWLAARAWVESGFRPVVSVRFRTGPGHTWRQSWGIMQTEVHRHCHPEYRGRERELLRPEVSFSVGAADLAYWWRWHEAGRCKCAGPWWRHYKWGYVVPPRARPRKGWKMENFRARFLRAMRGYSSASAAATTSEHASHCSAPLYIGVSRCQASTRMSASTARLLSPTASTPAPASAM